jgi:lipopolysaccharide transport protein LptA/LPS export ABC transporter protein LptC
VWVALSIRSRATPPGPGSGETTPSVADRQKTRMTEYTHVRYGKDGREVKVAAKDSEAADQGDVRLNRPDLSFTYSVDGKLEKGTIAAEQCVYTPTTGSARFERSVKVTTADGFVLETDSLSFDQNAGMARSDAPVKFQRKDVSGTGRGLVYDSNAGTLQLDNDVVMYIKDEDGTTEIKSQRAFVNRAEQTIRFVGDVFMTKNADEMRSEELIVNFNEAGDAVHRAEAIGKVRATFVRGHDLGAVDQGGGGGRREITGDKLDIFFRPDRTLEKMEAGPDGRLIVFPGPKDPPEKRHVFARLLTFFFDEQGRMVEVQGHKDSGFVIEPTVKGAGQKKTMDCQNFVARFDPATGQLDNGDFMKDVKFAWPGAEATAQKARYELHRAPGGLLMLKEEPAVRELTNGSRLSAVAIDVEPQTNNLAARREVRHVIPARKGAAGPMGAEADTVITSRLFHSDSKRGVFRYTDDAYMRSGGDELRGHEIIVENGGTKVTANRDVTSRLTPKGKDAEAGPAAAAVEAKARHMVYDEAKKQIDYEGEVILKHGEVTTLSPKSTVFLSADGKTFDRLEAGPKVRIDQGMEKGGKRQANSGWAVYRPEAKTVTLTGNAILTDEQGQMVRGDLIQFHLDKEAIEVQGQQARTETVLKKEPPAVVAPPTGLPPAVKVTTP